MFEKNQWRNVTSAVFMSDWPTWQEIACHGQGLKKVPLSLKPNCVKEAKESENYLDYRPDQSEGASAADSTYSLEKQHTAAVCFYCGNKGHGRNPPPQIKKKACTAYLSQIQEIPTHIGWCNPFTDRIVISPSLCNDVLTAFHSAHQGMSQMTARAESSLF